MTTACVQQLKGFLADSWLERRSDTGGTDPLLALFRLVVSVECIDDRPKLLGGLSGHGAEAGSI